MPMNELHSIMLEAYRPCAHFGVCRGAQWNPKSGHIPRGFFGATGKLSEVELVMVFPECGQPHEGEQYDPNLSPEELMEAAMGHAGASFKNKQDLYHLNVRWFISELYPNLTFEEQSRRVWMTDGRLCSIDEDIGGAIDTNCGANYLVKQIELLPNASVIGFGKKAQLYLDALRIEHIKAVALAPPAAKKEEARPSWENAIQTIKARKAGKR